MRFTRDIPLATTCFAFTEAILSIEGLPQNNLRRTISGMEELSSSLETCRVVHHKSPLLPDEPSVLTAMVILNAPIQKPVSPLFHALWSRSTFRVCADGGANRLRLASELYIPDMITGDLDSLLPATRQFYETKGVDIVPVVDQDRNDLDKAVTAVLQRIHYDPQSQQQQHPVRCIVYGAFGGRFDQEMASLQALYKYQHALQLFLYDDHTMAFLLPAGCVNHVHLALPKSDHQQTAASEGPVCGLIPLGCPVDSVTTTGLRWNLCNQRTAFGDLVSTSNLGVDSVITVQCTQSLVVTAQVNAGVATAWSE